MSYSCGGAVKFVLCVQNKEDLQSPDEFWVRSEVLLVELVHHAQEVFDIAQLIGWEVVLSADSVSVRVGCNGWHVAQDFIDLLISNLLVLVDSLAL